MRMGPAWAVRMKRAPPEGGAEVRTPWVECPQGIEAGLLEPSETGTNRGYLAASEGSGGPSSPLFRTGTMRRGGWERCAKTHRVAVPAKARRNGAPTQSQRVQSRIQSSTVTFTVTE